MFEQEPPEPDHSEDIRMVYGVAAVHLRDRRNPDGAWITCRNPVEVRQ